MTTATREPAPRAHPQINQISIADVKAALASGVKDFRRAPQYGLFFGGCYAICGWLIYAFLRVFDLHFLVYPLFIGFAFIAPFIATGFYDVSRKLEDKAPLSWKGVLTSVKGTSRRDLGWMALITGFVMIIWMDIAALLFFGFMGLQSASAQELILKIVSTPTGLVFLSLGTLTGMMISFLVFSITVASFPLLYDRSDIDFVTAMITSVKTVKENTGIMVLWYLTIAVLIGVSIATLLLGLLVTLPILGHATWHLYRRSIR